MTITDTLIAEHRAFGLVLAQAAQLLPELKTVEEVHAFARLFASLLHDHGDAEQNLVFAALDHMLAERGDLERLHQEHREVDASFHQVLQTKQLAPAREHLRAALRAAQDHFTWEEQSIFPLLHEYLREHTLRQLGTARAPSQVPILIH